MRLSVHHRLALAGAAAASAIAVGDAVTHGLTGSSSIFTDPAAPPWAMAVSFGVHGLAYVALAAVLVQERARLQPVNRAARISRWVTATAFAALAGYFLLLLPALGPDESGGTGTWLDGVAGAGFAGMLLGGLTLGIALWRAPAFRLESRLLVGLLPAFGLVLLLGWAAPGFAHPAYLEAMLYFGVATTGADLHVRARRRTPVPGGAF